MRNTALVQMFALFTLAHVAEAGDEKTEPSQEKVQAPIYLLKIEVPAKPVEVRWDMSAEELPNAWYQPMLANFLAFLKASSWDDYLKLVTPESKRRLETEPD